MCGRDTAFYSWRDVHAFSQPMLVATPAEDPEPVWNRAPTNVGWVLVAAPDLAPGGGAEARPMRWGLIPSWAKDAKLGLSTINARVETACSKPTFRNAWKHHRCLVPSSGYFEWQLQPDGRTKQPYFIHAADAPILMFAGLWERWRAPDGQLVDSYSVVTQPAAGSTTPLHDRMPLVLPRERLHDWLYCSPEQAVELAREVPPPALAFHPVDRAVGNVRNQGPRLIEPIPTQPPLR